MKVRMTLRSTDHMRDHSNEYVYLSYREARDLLSRFAENGKTSHTDFIEDQPYNRLLFIYASMVAEDRKLTKEEADIVLAQFENHEPDVIECVLATEAAWVANGLEFQRVKGLLGGAYFLTKKARKRSEGGGIWKGDERSKFFAFINAAKIPFHHSCAITMGYKTLNRWKRLGL